MHARPPQIAASKEMRNSSGTHRSMLSPPVLLGLTPHRLACRVLALDPVGRAAGAVHRRLALRHDAFEPESAGVAEDHVSRLVVDVLVEHQARPAVADEPGERGLAHLDRLASEII